MAYYMQQSERRSNTEELEKHLPKQKTPTGDCLRYNETDDPVTCNLVQRLMGKRLCCWTTFGPNGSPV
ncbi:Uncharacterized protein DAT39_014728 [Clarias magur]|uniref:Uncharacterized protein n=1 Tax=Clarias magur TaxID=1594786 RepID=A0A8J4UDW5_CLAMG|nr:Uncharacterized protein DAT39_014728 [Clarias magur]